MWPADWCILSNEAQNCDPCFKIKILYKQTAKCGQCMHTAILHNFRFNLPSPVPPGRVFWRKIAPVAVGGLTRVLCSRWKTESTDCLGWSRSLAGALCCSSDCRTWCNCSSCRVAFSDTRWPPCMRRQPWQTTWCRWRDRYCFRIRRRPWPTYRRRRLWRHSRRRTDFRSTRSVSQTACLTAWSWRQPCLQKKTKCV